VQEKYINKSPCEKVPWQKEGKVLIKTFNDDEIKRLLNYYDFSDYLNARNKTIIALLIDTGARNLEVCSIQKADVKEMHIIIKGKGNKERLVPVSPYLKKHLIKYDRIKEGYFKDRYYMPENYFLSRTGKPLTVEALERIVRLAGEKTKVRDEIRCSPHTFRHYFAQAQIKNGNDLYSISVLLGHEDTSITRRYLQSLQNEDILEKSIKSSPLMNLR
jgi:integrase/recombinase XerD